MFKTIITLILILTAFKAFSQPSKYEDSKYDTLYGWHKAREMNEKECEILYANKDTLLKLLDTLRKHNKSRAYISSLPKEVRDLEYTKQFFVKNTVPIFKLTVGSCPKEVALDKTHSYILLKDIAPQEYEAYLLEPDLPCYYRLDSVWDSGENKIIEINKTYQGKVFSIKDCNYTYVEASFFISERGECEAVMIRSKEKEECLKYVLTYIDAIANSEISPAQLNGELVKTSFTIKFIVSNYYKDE